MFPGTVAGAQPRAAAQQPGWVHTPRNSTCSTRRAGTLVAATSPSSAAPLPLVQECSVHNWKSPLRCDGRPEEASRDIVVALGKFDAMHLGHRSLAIKASEDGCQPVLLSFSGMAQVLGWPDRPPLVAHPDRPRVLASWAHTCNGRVPRQRMVPFHEIRGMSPEEFVSVLAQQLGAAGVVAGRNYRFGYRAAGDATALQQLGAKYGMRVHIMDLVSEADLAASGPHEATPPGKHGPNGGSGTALPPQVSSSKIRELLARGDVQGVQRLLGRRYRLVAHPAPEHSPQEASNHQVNHHAAPHSQGQRQHLQQVQLLGPGASTASTPAGQQGQPCSSGQGPSSSSLQHRGADADAVFLPAASFLNQPPEEGHYVVHAAWVPTGPQGQGSSSSNGSVSSPNGDRNGVVSGPSSGLRVVGVGESMVLPGSSSHSSSSWQPLLPACRTAAGLLLPDPAGLQGAAQTSQWQQPTETVQESSSCLQQCQCWLRPEGLLLRGLQQIPAGHYLVVDFDRCVGRATHPQ